MKTLLFPLLLSAALPAFAADTLTIDPMHSAVAFSWSHLGFSNPAARFEKIQGQIDLDAADIAKSRVMVTIPLSGLHMSIAVLDRRLQAPEFFDAARYPEITFRSTGITQGPMDTLKIAGDLSVHGVTRPVVLDAKVNRIAHGIGGEKTMAGFEADTLLRRTDFGVGLYVPSVGDDIHVHITVEAVQHGD